ncbi:MAG: type II secretion system F family protein [Oligoflexia bacterium]|nr:type II secretion system F family protein [Oligoflexia bacterium]
MDWLAVISVLTVAVTVRMMLLQRQTTKREYARFKGHDLTFLGEISQQLNTAAASLGQSSAVDTRTVGALARPEQKRRNQLMEDAGLETPEARGKFLLFRIVSAIAGPALGLSCYTVLIPYYATLATLVCTALGIALPLLWLKRHAIERREDIQRELPLVLDLTNLGTSAGWDISASLERVIDALFLEFPHHPLIKELKKARWLIPSGYTWEEALTRVADKLGDDSVRRSTLALAQAIKQGGDRSKQLEGIAMDAQRIYYGSIDRRLAGLPVKALLLTMMLMIAYFIILMAPAAVQIKNIVH